MTTLIESGTQDGGVHNPLEVAPQQRDDQFQHPRAGQAANAPATDRRSWLRDKLSQDLRSQTLSSPPAR